MRPHQTLSAKLPLWHRRGLTVAIAAAWGSGAVLLWALYFGRREGTFGLENHWVEFPARSFHGLVAYVCLLALGSLVPFHFRAGWTSGIRRTSALTMAIGATLLILTGWGLYYTGGDALRRGLSLTHSGMGLLLLPLFFIHSRRKPF